MSLTLPEIELIFKQNLSEDIKTIAIQRGGVSSTTYRVVTSSEKLYYFKENENNHALELSLTKKLTSVGIPLPNIVAVGKPWMIMDRIDGIPLKSVKDRNVKLKVLKECGSLLATINSFKISGFGPLTDIGVGKYSSYFSFYEDLYNLLPSWQQPLILDYLRSVKESFLAHGDIAQSHIYVDAKGDFEAFIDIDDVLGAPYYYDLAEFDAGNDFDEDLWKALTQSYAIVTPPPEHYTRELKIEEYLITFDSYNWYLKNPQIAATRKEKIDAEKNRLKVLEKSIWK